MPKEFPAFVYIYIITLVFAFVNILGTNSVKNTQNGTKQLRLGTNGGLRSKSRGIFTIIFLKTSKLPILS